jgi:predicted Fe-Mo cluster-binding NifX family protein
MDQPRNIAIASLNEQGLEGEVSAHFGRCPFYTLIRIDEGAVTHCRVVPNPHADQHVPGTMPSFIHRLGTDVILAGGMGPRAIRMFGDLGIEVVTGAVGATSAVLAAYLSGELTGIVPCAHDHPDSCGGHAHG